MTHEEIRKIVTKVSGEDPEKVKHIINIFFDVCAEALSLGQELKFRSFGKFEQRKISGRQGTNMQTGERVCIPPYRRIVFIPSKEIKSILNK